MGSPSPRPSPIHDGAFKAQSWLDFFLSFDLCSLLSLELSNGWSCMPSIFISVWGTPNSSCSALHALSLPLVSCVSIDLSESPTECCWPPEVNLYSTEFTPSPSPSSALLLTFLSVSSSDLLDHLASPSSSFFIPSLLSSLVALYSQTPPITALSSPVTHTDHTLNWPLAKSGKIQKWGQMSTMVCLRCSALAGAIGRKEGIHLELCRQGK